MKILVLGVGNILFGDEGIGVHLSYLLKRNYKFTLAGGMLVKNSEGMPNAPLDSSDKSIESKNDSTTGGVMLERPKAPSIDEIRAAYEREAKKAGEGIRAPIEFNSRSIIPSAKSGRSDEKSVDFDSTSSDENCGGRQDLPILDIIDGGTGAFSLIPLISSYDYVLILDAIGADGGEIGDVYRFSFTDIPKNINFEGSAHEVEMLQTLRMMELLGDLPTIDIIGIIPERIGDDTCFDLSPSVIKNSAVMVDATLKILEGFGISSTKVADNSVQDLAYNSYKPLGAT